MVDENAAHRFGRNSQKVRAAFPSSRPLIDEFEVRLMNQCGGLKRVTRSFFLHLLVGQGMQPVVDNGHDALCGARFAGG
jgi:hypothetical protein